MSEPTEISGLLGLSLSGGAVLKKSEQENLKKREYQPRRSYHGGLINPALGAGQYLALTGRQEQGMMTGVMAMESDEIPPALARRSYRRK